MEDIDSFSTKKYIFLSLYLPPKTPPIGFDN